MKAVLQVDFEEARLVSQLLASEFGSHGVDPDLPIQDQSSPKLDQYRRQYGREVTDSTMERNRQLLRRVTGIAHRLRSFA